MYCVHVERACFPGDCTQFNVILFTLCVFLDNLKMSAKVDQALEHVREAEKALKTGFFKWNPDFDTAASEYTKAANCFKLGNLPEKCKDSYLKAADMQEKLGNLFHSAKLLTLAAGVASDLDRMDEAVNLMEKAGILYRYGNLC